MRRSRRFVPALDSLQARITPTDGPPILTDIPPESLIDADKCPLDMPPIVEYRPDFLGSQVPLDLISQWNYIR